mmetsp:Transcript_33672/g.79714  ORF Transcript_33672/g.79714 Transcript_33672/m.79714 type:complete len:261 (+) Transcript_33672:349-1131(+)
MRCPTSSARCRASSTRRWASLMSDSVRRGRPDCAAWFWNARVLRSRSACIAMCCEAAAWRTRRAALVPSTIRSHSSTTRSAFRASSAACWCTEMARWSQQLPKSCSALHVAAASGSPVFCSWLPNVMRVSPSSASELPSSLRRHTRRSMNLCTSDSWPSSSLAYAPMASNSGSGIRGWGLGDMSLNRPPKKEDFFSSGVRRASSRASKKSWRGLEVQMTGCCVRRSRNLWSARRLCSTNSSWKRFSTGPSPLLSGSAGMK